MRFTDREEAGKLLAKKLAAYQGKDAVVYALPRGGVVTGEALARELHLPLDVIVTRKIGHPEDEEYAIAAVNENGDVVSEFLIPEALTEWLSRAKNDALIEISRRKELFQKAGGTPARGKIAIIADDGIATGLTMLAAIRAITKEQPKKIVVASPIAPPEVREMLRRECDELILLEETPDYLGAVGAYYDHFPQLTDNEVLTLLRDSAKRKARTPVYA